MSALACRRKSVYTDLLRGLVQHGCVCVDDISEADATDIEYALSVLSDGFFAFQTFRETGILCMVDKRGLILYGRTSLKVC